MKSEGSSEELGEEINDKIHTLWESKRGERLQRRRELTPSRRLNQTTHQEIEPQKLFAMRDKLAVQVNLGKHKDLQIEALTQAVAELTNDKKILLGQIQKKQFKESPQRLNESSISPLEQSKAYDQSQKIRETAAFTAYQPKKVIGKQNLEDFNKCRLVELLRSTSEYREFVYYYDSHELSYLRRLNQQHRKNCARPVSSIEKLFWAPKQILDEWKVVNKEENIGLSPTQMQILASRMKVFYQKNQQHAIKKVKQQYEQKLRRAQRVKSLPYDLVQVCKVKQRQLASKKKQRK